MRRIIPIGLQGVVHSSEHDADIGGMGPGGVKVGIVSDFRGHQHGDLGSRLERLLEGLREGQRVSRLGKGEELLETGADATPRSLSGSHERVEVGGQKEGVVDAEDAVGGQKVEVDHEAAQRTAEMSTGELRGGEDAIRQVLEGEVAVIIDRDPRL